MSEGQFSRGLTLVFCATLAARLICFVLNLLLFQGPYFYIFWPLIIATAISTFLTLSIGWKQYCEKSESKKRGRNFGIICGFILLIFAAIIFNSISYLALLQECKKGDFWSSSCEKPVFNHLSAISITVLIVFIFGGFVAPVIGGFVGYRIAEE